VVIEGLLVWTQLLRAIICLACELTERSTRYKRSKALIQFDTKFRDHSTAVS
jgi:hypothetical protein